QDADQIMSIASPLDLHPSVFPENGATFSEVFGLKALILRQPEGFCVAVEQSFGDMIEDYFARAMS
ncbi:MAG: sarcosine oxidase subunit gamma, partial [Boseongicola sp.]